MEKKLPELLAEVDQAFAGEGPIRLKFQDEARFGRIADTRRCWCPAPQRPLCQVMITQEYTCAYAAVSVPDGALDSLILPHVNTECMQVFVDDLARRYAARVLMVLDGAGWHRGSELAWPVNIRPLPLLPYSPELNPVEQLWDEIREKSFHNCVCDSLAALEDHLVNALLACEQDPDRVRSITVWTWIINSLLKAN